jgi:hypothetical protein
MKLKINSILFLSMCFNILVKWKVESADVFYFLDIISIPMGTSYVVNLVYFFFMYNVVIHMITYVTF